MANTKKKANNDAPNRPSIFFIIAILIAMTIFVLAFLNSIPDKAKEPDEEESQQSRIEMIYDVPGVLVEGLDC